MNHTRALARPLYLHNGRVECLELDAAQRLRIVCTNQADRFIPLHHVSRIVCAHTLNISARVIMACMQQGIPLAVLDQRGKTLGWCMGSRRKESSLRQLLLHALDDPAWDELYATWYGNQRMAIAAQTLLLCNVMATPAARRHPRAALCNAHKRKHQHSCAYVVDHCAELAKQALATHLLHETQDPALLAWYRPGLNLLDELGHLMGLHAHTDVHHSAQLPTPEEASAWAVHNHERHAHHWQQRIAQLALAFEQFLRTHWL